MYIRFVCAHPHPYADAEIGIYLALDYLIWDDQPAWLVEAFSEAWDHAFAEMAVPPRINTADGRRALCWLRSDQHRHVRALRHLGWVIGEMGLPIAEISCRDPGRILYRDPRQVVAIPERAVPRAFRRPLGY